MKIPRFKVGPDKRSVISHRYITVLLQILTEAACSAVILSVGSVNGGVVCGRIDRIGIQSRQRGEHKNGKKTKNKQLFRMQDKYLG